MDLRHVYFCLTKITFEEKVGSWRRRRKANGDYGLKELTRLMTILPCVRESLREMNTPNFAAN